MDLQKEITKLVQYGLDHELIQPEDSRKIRFIRSISIWRFFIWMSMKNRIYPEKRSFWKIF